MDFMNRGGRPVQQNTHSQDHGVDAPKASGQKSGGNKNDKWTRWSYVGFLGAVTILIIAVVLSLVFTKDVGSKEFSKVNTGKFQAVFLNGGQVYFGKIDDLNTKYLSLNNIYYLRVNQQVQPNQTNTNTANDISLVKLGCELHGPQDSMVINREQVIFWENLKDDGQVAKAVADYVSKNPKGQDCNQQNNTGSTNTGGNTTTGTTENNATTTNNTNNTNTSTSTTKKP